jgi:surfactin synthase thioesterase subunit/acyl carrier protein
MVLVRDGAKEDPADKRLVAYIVKNPMIAASTRELRRFLRQKLPEYMLPAAIVFMDALPLTPNGKLDRKALPAPEASVSDGRENFVAPRSAFERIMVDIWVEVLQVERVSRDDNFFDLGGYSLLGIKLLAQIKNRLDVELPTRYLFESPTVAQLVKRIEIEAGKSYQLPAELQTLRHLRKLREGQGTLKIFCFPYYGGFNDELLHLARLAHLMGPEHSFYAVVAGPHAELASRLSVEHRARAYIADIRQIQPHGPYFLTGGCLGGPLAFETALQLQELGETVSWLALCDVRARPPSKFNRYLGRSLGTWVNYYVTFIMGWRGWRYFPSAIRFHRRKLSKLTRQERWHYIVGKTKRALDRISSWEPDKQRAGDGESDPSWWHPYDLKNAKKRYFLASRTYDFRPYHGKLTIITNEVWYDEDPTLGWKDFAMGGLDVKKLPGDHDAFAVNNFELFLRIMRESLRKAISE